MKQRSEVHEEIRPSHAASPRWHALPADEVRRYLSTDDTGLSEAEAARRLARFGPNEIPEKPPPGLFTLFLRQFRSPLIYILLVGVVISLLIREYVDAIVVGAAVLLKALIGLFQERQAESALRALRQLSAPRSRVLREGVERLIPSRELVPGDVVLLESGTRVPADLRLSATTSLLIDESLLTGESTAVAKHPAPTPDNTPLAERTSLAYAGTVVVSGRGRGYVVATGLNTELGAIATQMREAEDTATPLQQRVDHLARSLALVTLVAAVTTFAIGTVRGESAVEMLLVAVALAVAAVPEGLPVGLTITLAAGVRRMAQRNAIVRHLLAAETLGSTTVIGSDKTGTLTQNRMTVRGIWTVDQYITPDAANAPARSGAAVQPATAAYQTLLIGVLANEATIDLTPDGYRFTGDPTEAALLIAAHRLGLDPDALRQQYPSVAEVPFESERRFSASLRRTDEGYLLAVKGAPERLLPRCEGMLRDGAVAPLDIAAVQAALDEMARRGMRVLAMVYRTFAAPPADPASAVEAGGLIFAGLQGMIDPPRPGVREAIAGCHRAGIRVLMITGDHAATAAAIAQDLGIAEPGAPILTSTDLQQLSDDALRQQVRRVQVYARVTPQDKLRVVLALKGLGEVVAVTGDGVNDGPALRAADIGVAMGRSGTDVAREAADMVLADDNFVTIYEAVREGRTAFDNVRKVTLFLVATNAAEVTAVVTAIAIGWPLPLLPAQILWLNLATEGLQDVALAFEPAEGDVLARKPIRRNEPILSRLLWERVVIAGLIAAAGALAMFNWELDRSGSLTSARSVALTTLVVIEAVQVFNVRSLRHSAFRVSPLTNRFLLAATLGGVLLHILALYLPPTQYLLRLEPVSLDAWLRMGLVAAAIVVAMELHKRLRRNVS
ncbi:MAG: HAD-IC family P-type ATPase [Sphaerobacter sp.]|nr:HAD-IC family P-type ATPase [Sphaerobacter sp.]